MVTNIYDSVYKYRFMFNQTSIQTLSKAFSDLPGIFEKKYRKTGLSDLKLKMMKQSLHQEPKSSEVRDVTIEELNISLPDGYT